jgi:hypothetical protein
MSSMNGLEQSVTSEIVTTKCKLNYFRGSVWENVSEVVEGTVAVGLLDFISLMGLLQVAFQPPNSLEIAAMHLTRILLAGWGHWLIPICHGKP